MWTIHHGLKHYLILADFVCILLHKQNTVGCVECASSCRVCSERPLLAYVAAQELAVASLSVRDLITGCSWPWISWCTRTHPAFCLGHSEDISEGSCNVQISWKVCTRGGTREACVSEKVSACSGDQSGPTYQEHRHWSAACLTAARFRLGHI